MSDTAQEVRERFCPRCGTVHPVSEAGCPHCGLDLGWLDEGRREFAEALLVRGDDPPCEVEFRAVWGEAAFETRVVEGTRIELVAGPAGPVSVATDGAGVCRVDFGPGHDALSWSLPGRIEHGGVVFSARRCVAAVGGTSPLRLAPHGAEYVLTRPTFVVGRASSDAAVPALPSNDVAPRHAVVAWESPGADRPPTCWIAAARQADGSRPGVVVNGRLVLAGRLESGDLLRIGPFGWVVNLEDGLLVPAGPIDGAAVRMESVRVGHRLGPVDLEIAAGSLVAVIGPSGAGKSTLVRALVDGRSVGRTGQILVSEGDPHAPRTTNWRDVDEHADRFRSWLGFVPQESILHPELTVRDALRWSARLRGRHPDPHEVRRVLQQVDLPETRWDAPCRELSGGEDKRVRTAAELLHAPRLLLLDEPASGLDPQRERSLLRLLRTLASRGCTVLVVTHNWTDLGVFDRLVEVRGGAIVYDGPPDRRRSQRLDGMTATGRTTSPATGRERRQALVREAAGACASLGSRCAAFVQWAMAIPPATEIRQLQERFVERAVADARQFRELLGRECRRTARDPAARLGVPLLVLPLFFAAVLAVGIPVGSRSLFGFLAVLSCIWMGSSLSLGAIVGERRILDHERLLFLRRVPYLAAKLVPLWCLALAQTAVFLALLWPLRTWLLAWTRTDRPLGEDLLDIVCVAGILGLVSLAAVGQGLLVSAVAGSRPALANFLLPLLMMAQIVFSVHVAGDAPDAELHEAYDRLAVFGAPDGGSSRDRLAGLGSHLTISRPADVALRSFAYHRVHSEVEDTYAYGQRRRRALTILWFQALALPAATAAVLGVQERLAAWKAWVFAGAVLPAASAARSTARNAAASRDESPASGGRVDVEETLPTTP